MPLPGRSYQRPDDGFVRAYDAQAAKRQFQVSAALVLVLAAAAAVLGMFAPPNRPTTVGRPMTTPVSAENFSPSHDHDGAAVGLPAEILKDEP